MDALFERERTRGDPPDVMKAEVRARLDATLAGKPAIRGDLDSRPPASAAGRAAPGLWAGVRPPLLAAGLGFVLVGGLGLIWMGQHRPPVQPPPPAAPEPVPQIAVPAPETAVPVPAPGLPATLPDSPSRMVRHPVAHQEHRAPAPPPPAPAPSARDADLELAIERDLLQRARADFRAGRLTEALRPLEEHARRFPRGRLEEERAALRIQTLARLGENRRAAELAREFSTQFPESPLLGAVRASIGTGGGPGGAAP